MTNIKIISKEAVYKNPHTGVDQITFVAGDNKEHKYNVVNRKKAICILFETNDDHIGMIKQYRIAVGETLDELVAGQIEQGENPIETAQKELLEEAGYDIDANDIKIITNIYTSSGFTNEELILMTGTKANYIGRLDSHEASEDIQSVKLSKKDFVKRYINGVHENMIRESKLDIIIMRGAVQGNPLCIELLSMITNYQNENK